MEGYRKGRPIRNSITKAGLISRSGRAILSGTKTFRNLKWDYRIKAKKQRSFRTKRVLVLEERSEVRPAVGRTRSRHAFGVTEICDRCQMWNRLQIPRSEHEEAGTSLGMTKRST